MRSLACFLSLLIVPAVSRGHWVWVFPDKADAKKAHVVFAHHPAPDNNPKLLDKIADAKLWVRTAGGDQPVAWKRGDEQYSFPIPGPVTVGGVNQYGVVEKKGAKPFRLVQCPKLVMGEDARPWARLPIEIVPSRKGGKLKLAVIYAGKPAPVGLEVTVHAPDEAKAPVLKTDADGVVEFAPKGEGLFGFTVPHTVAEAGELGGKKYGETRYSASLLLLVGKAKPAAKGDAAAIELFNGAPAAPTGRISLGSRPTSPLKSRGRQGRARSSSVRITN